MICVEPPDDDDIECPQCGADAVQVCQYSVKCTECSWHFESLPEDFIEENDSP